MDWLISIYILCFTFGLIFTLALFFWGKLEPANASSGQIVTFDAIVVFLTWFGGSGFILNTVGLNFILSITLAVIIGVAGYVAVFSWVIRPKPVALNDYNLIGTVATVNSAIFQTNIGHVTFLKDGVHYTFPARSTEGQTFRRGSQVVILRTKNGVAFVEDIERLLHAAGAEKWLDNEINKI